jgi:hypothetical protein
LKSDAVQPFSCVWNWRTNTVGLTIKSRSRVVVTHSVSGVLLALQLAMAQLKFCSGVGGGRKLVHWSSLLESSWESDHRIRKGVYDVATLSPPDTINQPRNEFRLSSPLIMGSKSVSFPVYYNVSSCSAISLLFCCHSCFSHYFNRLHQDLMVKLSGEKHGSHHHIYRPLDHLKLQQSVETSADRLLLQPPKASAS